MRSHICVHRGPRHVGEYVAGAHRSPSHDASREPQAEPTGDLAYDTRSRGGAGRGGKQWEAIRTRRFASTWPLLHTPPHLASSGEHPLKRTLWHPPTQRGDLSTFMKALVVARNVFDFLSSIRANRVGSKIAEERRGVGVGIREHLFLERTTS